MRRIVFALGLALLLASEGRANLIVNPSFETGDLTGWTPTGSVSVTPYTFPGDGSFGAAFGFGGTPADGVLSQTFATVAGQVYELSFDYGANGAAGETQSVLVEVDGTANLLSQAITGDPPLANFNAFSFLFTADSASTTLTFSATTGTPSLATDGQLDTVFVAATPEPSTLGLTALGGLALVVLRKRIRRPS